MIYIKLLLITLIVVNITDISGVVYSFKCWLAKRLKCEPHQIKIKIIECSYCQNWWLSLMYLLYVNKVTLFNVFFVLIMSFLTTVFVDLQYKIKDLIIKIIDKI